MKSTEYIEQIRKLEWMESVERLYSEYLNRMDKEKENFVIQSIGFTARGDGEKMQINPHFPIPYNYICAGLNAARVALNDEIKELRGKLKTVSVEL